MSRKVKVPENPCGTHLKRGHRDCGLCMAYYEMRKAVFFWNHAVDRAVEMGTLKVE